jgi:hypothetical protein
MCFENEISTTAAYYLKAIYPRVYSKIKPQSNPTTQ